MVNHDELAICKRRGHDSGLVFDQKWKPCKWCGIWLREVHTIEEREAEPPPDEQSPPAKLLRGD
jgi:hypothetical protein